MGHRLEIAKDGSLFDLTPGFISGRDRLLSFGVELGVLIDFCSCDIFHMKGDDAMKGVRRSRAFAGGFAFGLTSPFRVMMPGRTQSRFQIHDTLSEAWRDVGKGILETIDVEDRQIGKTARRKATAKTAAN